MISHSPVPVTGGTTWVRPPARASGERNSPLGHMDHFSAGWVTPVLSYAMACLGSALGLRCTVRALESDGASKRNWLTLASFAIGSGIWTMHFVAMMGFIVEGTPIRYEVQLTVLRLVTAIAVV